MNGDSIDRYGEIMRQLGAISATLQSHIADEMANVAATKRELEEMRRHLAVLEAALSAGTMLARILRVMFPILVALIGAVWALAEHWHRLFPGGPPSGR